MAFMNFVRDLFAAPPAPQAEPAPGFGYGESQLGDRRFFPRSSYGSDATGSDATSAGDLQTVAGNYGESQLGARPPFPRPIYGSDTGSDATLAGDIQTVAGNYGGFAEGFGNEALVAGSPSAGGLAWDGGAYGAPAPADGLDRGYGAPAPTAGLDLGRGGYGSMPNTDMSNLLQNVATVSTDLGTPTFDAKLTFHGGGWG